jgi:hypothetical protein
VCLMWCTHNGPNMGSLRDSTGSSEMPVSANPRKQEFYVYQFKVNDYPFYVGIGRSRRGPDRMRYVRSLLTPQNRATLERSSLCVRVIAKLIQKNKGKKLVYLLTNWQHNPFRHQDADLAVTAILAGRRFR